MPARRFFLWNVIGGLIWTEGILLAGYALAARIKSVIPPDKIDNYLLPVVALIVLVSAIPIFIEIIRERRARRRSYSARRDQADRAQANGGQTNGGQTNGGRADRAHADQAQTDANPIV
jgi:membrane-associated protein